MDCKLFSIDNEGFSMMKHWYETNPIQHKELTTLIIDILNDNSNKLALLNLKHYNGFVQFISKYKLNLNCEMGNNNIWNSLGPL